jgi:hypothetical protein
LIRAAPALPPAASFALKKDPKDTEGMTCAICHTRRAKRFCPGVGGDICTICCGKEREITVTCPLDCEYLLDARRHEKLPPLPDSETPNRDIRVTEAFLREHEELLAALASILSSAALETSGAFDNDIREALDALIRTYRTLESGLYYETRPDNALAFGLSRAVRAGIEKLHEQERQTQGTAKTRDSDILTALVFFHRLEGDRNNGRPRGRAFIGLLRSLARPSPESPLELSDSRLVLP